ncbi:MAG: hypothetical protein KF868_08000 [Acidobacteria bacterium]|nr:hypothetical protein [Acidobacteriota bacterium]MCW5970674.1 hypothetical protein [Blastocatellales bacterium]
MEGVLFAIALVLMLVAGAGATVLLAPFGRRLHLTEAVSLSILFGAGFISLSLFLCGFVAGGRQLLFAVAAGAIALGMTGWRGRHRTGIARLEQTGWIDRIGAVVIALQCLVVAWASVRLALGYDGLFIWEFKAQLVHRSGGRMPVEYFGESPWQFTHPNYPLFLPFVESWFYGWMGRVEQGWVKLVSPLFYFAVVGLLVSGGARLGARRWGIAAAMLFFFIPWAVLRTTAGEADLPLAAVYLAAALYLLEYAKTGDGRLPAAAGVISALLPWVKRDGMVLWACLLIAVMLLTVVRREWRRFALPGAVWLVCWGVFLSLVKANEQPVFLPVSPGTAAANIDRAPIIARAIFDEMTNWRSWSLVWVLPVLGLVQVIAGARQRRLTLLWLLLIVAPVTLYGSIYIFSAWEPFTGHIGSSLGRLLLHVAPVALLGAAILFREGRETTEQTK